MGQPKFADNIDYSDLTANTSSPKYTVGTRFIAPQTDSATGAVAGSEYMYVRFYDGAGTVACAVGTPLGVYTPSGGSPVGSVGVVTSDISDSTTSLFTGIAMGTLTDAYYGWVCVKGQCEANLDNTGAVAIANAMYWSGDLELDVATVGTNHVVGHAVDAVVSGDGTRGAATVILNGCGV